MTKYDFGKSVLENIAVMSEQRSLSEVASECDIAFCRYSKKIEGLEVINADDPLKAAIYYAYKNDKTCLVHEHNWFCKVPSLKINLKGWVSCVKLWHSIKQEKAAI